MITRHVLAAAEPRAVRRQRSLEDLMEVTKVATMWTLIEVCIADAARAEELVHDLTARRELRLDPDTALAGFSLWPGRAARDLRRVDLHGERRRLVDPQGQVEEKDAA